MGPCSTTQGCGPTCGEGHEGISSDKSALVVQEVGGVERVRCHPFALIMQDRSEEGDDHRALWADRTSEGEHGIINVGDIKAGAEPFR